MRISWTVVRWLVTQSLLLILSVSIMGWAGSNALGQDDDSDNAKAVQLAQTALNAQNEGSFEFAVKEWQSLLEKYPQSDVVDRAHFNAGVCHIQLQQFAAAIEQFEKAIPKLTDQEVQVPTAKFYLGYAQFELGSNLLDGDDTQKQKAIELLTTSTKVFEGVLKDHPKFEKADNVCFFQAGAFERLDRIEEALAAYKNMANFKSTNNAFFFDSLFAICDLNVKLGRYDEALKACDRMIAQAKPVEHPLLDKVVLLKGSVLVLLGDAAYTKQDREAAKTQYELADNLFKEFLSQESAGKPEGFADLAADAKYQRAFCLTRLEKFEEAANVYADLAKSGAPELKAQVQAYAGANYSYAGKTDEAIAMLTQAIESDSKFAVDSAHLLSEIYRKQKKFQQAYDVATRFLPKATADSPVLVDLMMDQADAAFELEDKRKDSVALFDAIVKNHPQHRLAPGALYASAFASLTLEDFQAAVDKSTRLENEYGDSRDLAGALEVKADALLSLKEFAKASEVLTRLATDKQFESDPARKKWQLRSGVALYPLKQYQAAIDRLQPLAGTFGSSAENAEAYHWIGSSHFQLNQFAQAEAAFSETLKADAKWTRADESIAFLCLSQLSQSKRADAEKNLKLLVDTFPKSVWLSDVYFMLGSKDVEADQYREALVNLEKVISGYPKSRQFASALYNAAWSHQNLKQFDDAEKYYKQLIEEFPTNPLVENAKIQRASLQRMSGNSDAAIPELKKLLETSLENKERVGVLLELGRAQVAGKDWEGAVKSYEELVEIAKTDSRLDEFYYELAWANHELKNYDRKLEYFGKIASEIKSSKYAAEANFHLGNAAYDKKDYPEAITRFTECMEPNVESNIREKAAYKLGWSFFKQEQFSEARGAFQRQVDSFADGDLYADGVFMLAETYHKQKKYPEAFAAYVKAKPAVDASEIVDAKLKWLTMLHGAQSAIKAKDYEGAIKLAEGIELSEADESFKQDVYVELGSAYKGLKDLDKAISFWQRAAEGNNTKSGARALCMIGDHYFAKKDFSEAINQFKRVYFGFGTTQAADDVKPWLAYARYEAARCSYVQVKDASPEMKTKLVQDAIREFEALVRDYPKDRLAPEAEKQLGELKKVLQTLGSE